MNTCGPNLVPAIHTLAANFAVSDRWFCSLPGPIWPNRFFAMMGSCHGSISMEAENAKLDAVSKTLHFYFKESIFSLLGDNARIYSQESQTAAQMVNGTGFSTTHLSEFEKAVATDTLPQLSWVEPNHRSGEINNQHPAQDVRLGDNFIARIYSILRKSPEVFAKTLFVVDRPDIILDCCHAGGMTRGAGRIRGINPPHDIRHRMMRWDEPSRSWQGRPYARICEQREFTGDTNKSPNPYRSRQGQSADCRILDR